MRKNKAASALIKLRWSRIPKRERAQHVPRNGGAPRIYAQCTEAKYHRWNENGRCRFCGRKRKPL